MNNEKLLMNGLGKKAIYLLDESFREKMNLHVSAEELEEIMMAGLILISKMNRDKNRPDGNQDE